MPATLIALLAVHVLATLFWLFASFILARSGGAGSQKMFRWQMLAATVAVFSGGGLWSLLHRGAFGPPEMVLAAGAFQSSTAHSRRPRFSSMQRCARAASRALPAPRPRASGATNRSST